jgi:hypothetical protein
MIVMSRSMWTAVNMFAVAFTSTCQNIKAVQRLSTSVITGRMYIENVYKDTTDGSGGGGGLWERFGQDLGVIFTV